jgi:hypothetical protein
MIGAMRSDKPEVEHQQHVPSTVNLRQLHQVSFMIGQRKVWRCITYRQTIHHTSQGASDTLPVYHSVIAAMSQFGPGLVPIVTGLILRDLTGASVTVAGVRHQTSQTVLSQKSARQRQER